GGGPRGDLGLVLSGRSPREPLAPHGGMNHTGCIRGGTMRGAILLAVSLLCASPVAAQSEVARGYLFREPPVTISLRGGLANAIAGGDLWAFTFDELTLGRRDFT